VKYRHAMLRWRSGRSRGSAITATRIAFQAIGSQRTSYTATGWPTAAPPGGDAVGQRVANVAFVRSRLAGEPEQVTLFGLGQPQGTGQRGQHLRGGGGCPSLFELEAR
jgi:hypothetical protein